MPHATFLSTTLLVCSLPVFFAASWLQTPHRAKGWETSTGAEELYTALSLPAVAEDTGSLDHLFHAQQPGDHVTFLATPLKAKVVPALLAPAWKQRNVKPTKPLRTLVPGRKGRWSNNGEFTAVLPKYARTLSETWSHTACLPCEPAKASPYMLATRDLFAGQKPWEAQFLSRKQLRELFEAAIIPHALSNLLYKMTEVMHRVFEAQGLHYVADGGTSLGAVRHGGIIPWDDDVDVLIAKEQIPFLIGPVRDALRQEGYDVHDAGRHRGGTMLYKIRSLDPRLSEFFLDIFIGEDQADGWWG